MSSSIFIPKDIKVGYQNRKDTYSEKLAYIIYYDEKGKLRKEASWKSWHDNKIDPNDFKNVPTEGFVLNKKVGDYHGGHSWDNRNAYIRVWDPRDFEFEITPDNLLYILANCSSIKGKGLEGEFVYAWDGTELILMPVNSPDYKEIKDYSRTRLSNKKISARDLIIGATYLDKNNKEYIYLGRYDYWDEKAVYKNTTDRYGYRYKTVHCYEWVNKGKKHWFISQELEYKWSKRRELITPSSIPSKFIDIKSEECVENYTELFEEMKSTPEFSPPDRSKDKKVYYTKKDLLKIIEKLKMPHTTMLMYYYLYFISDVPAPRYYKQDDFSPVMEKNSILKIEQKRRTREDKKTELYTIDEFLEIFKPYYIQKYLTNNKLYSKETR